jgi:hypothetical protein
MILFASIELEKILSEQCDTHALIDNVLRAYLGFTAQFKGMSNRMTYTVYPSQRNDNDASLRYRGV